MADLTPQALVGYLLLAPELLPADHDTDPPLDLAHGCDLLGEQAPVVEPDPGGRGAWFQLRAGKRAPAPDVSGAALRTTLAQQGLPTTRVAFAPTPGVARLAARLATAPVTVLLPDAVPAFLAPVSIETLGLDEDATTRLHLVGLGTLGAIAALPRGALGDYLGALGAAVEALARGADDRPLVPRRPPLVLRAQRDLDWPLVEHTQLVTLLQRLAAPLAADLARRGLGVTRAGLRLASEVHAHRLVARLPRPTAEVGALVRALVAEWAALVTSPGDDGGNLDPAGEWQEEAGEAALAGITAVTLTLVAPRPLAARQASFFDVPQGRLAQLHAGLAEARRRGEGPVGYLRPLDPTHPRPERRYTLDATARPPTEEAAR